MRLLAECGIILLKKRLASGNKEFEVTNAYSIKNLPIFFSVSAI